MTRQEFLGFLNKRLQVLKQQEREDILSEYEQHIMMRMENGLSEEDAIKDFGNLEELVSEILDAYHVDGECGKKTLGIDKREVGRQVSEGVSGACSKAGKGIGALWGFFKKMLQAAAGGIKRAVYGTGGWLKKIWSRLRRACAGPETTEKRRSPALPGKRNGYRGEMMMIKKAGRFFMWCIGICIKGAALLFLSPFFLCALFLLMSLGILAVLLAMGYPLWGVTILTLGLTMCSVSFIWLVSDVVFRKKGGNGSEN